MILRSWRPPLWVVSFLSASILSVPSILNATEVRWADNLIGVSSQYDSPDYGGVQVIGVPDVYPNYDDSAQAWASLNEDASREYIELGYSDPIQVETIAIVETYNPGAVDKVLLRDASNNLWNEVWTGTPAVEPEEARIFFISITKTSYLVNGVRVELASSAVPGWNEIDAVAILDGSSDAIAPSIGIPDLTENPVLYTELASEIIEVEVDVSDSFNGVATVTFQFLDPSGVPVGETSAAQLNSGSVENGNWVGQAVLPQGSTTGDYGLRIVATGGQGDSSTLDLPEAFEVVDLLPRPGNSFSFTKIAEIGDYAFTYPSLSYDILSFENAPVMNGNGLVAFEVNLVNNLGGGGSAIITGDGNALDTIVGDEDIRYAPDLARRSGRSIAINDSGWLAFKGFAIGQGGISGIYKTDGNTIVEIDSIGSAASIDPPIGNAWINNNGQVSYFKYNETTFDLEVWVGDGSSTTRYYGYDDQVVPEWYPGMGATGPVGKRVTNIGMDIVLDSGDLISNITLRDFGAPNLTYHAIVRVPATGGIDVLELAHSTSVNTRTYFYSLNYPVVAASAKGRYAFVGQAIPPSGISVGLTPGIDMLLGNTVMMMTSRGLKDSGLGFGGRVFGNPAIYGPSVNDLNVVAYRDSGGIPPSFNVVRRYGIKIKSSGRPVRIINENDLLEGRRVKSFFMSRQALNNSNQVAFLVEFYDGHQAIYRADPVLPQVLAPIFPTLETMDPIGGTIGYEFTDVNTGEYLKLPNSPEIEITLPDVGDLIMGIAGMSTHLANPVEVLVNDTLVGEINEGEAFDIAAVTAGGASSIKLRNIVATPTFGGSLGIALEFNNPSAAVDVEASTAPLLVQPYSFPLIEGAQAIIRSGAFGDGAFTFQWSKDDVSLVEDIRVLGVDKDTLQINPVAPSDAGTYKLVGTGAGSRTSSIELPMIAGRTFSEWIGGFYPGESNDAIVGAGSSPAGDGVSNIAKFLFGLDPTVTVGSEEAAQLVKLSIGGTGEELLPVLDMALNPEAIGVSVRIETASEVDPNEWVPLDSGAMSVTESNVNGEKRYKLRMPANLDPNQFYRVSVRSTE